MKAVPVNKADVPGKGRGIFGEIVEDFVRSGEEAVEIQPDSPEDIINIRSATQALNGYIKRTGHPVKVAVRQGHIYLLLSR